MKTKVLFYCTKGKPYFKKCNHFMALSNHEIGNEGIELNGKIVCECEVECESFEWWSNSRYDDGYINEDGKNITKELCKKSCLTYEQLFDYVGGSNNGYALHISNLKVFDKPLELNELVRNCINDNCLKCKNFDSHYFCPTTFKKIEKAPQNMMWVWYKGEKYCLISIRPEWLCKVANGEKTIEVRKKILKGMM